LTGGTTTLCPTVDLKRVTSYTHQTRTQPPSLSSEALPFKEINEIRFIGRYHAEM